MKGTEPDSLRYKQEWVEILTNSKRESAVHKDAMNDIGKVQKREKHKPSFWKAHCGRQKPKSNKERGSDVSFLFLLIFDGFLSRLLAVLSQDYRWIEMGSTVRLIKCLRRFANSCSTHSQAPQKKCSRHLFHGWRWQLGSGAPKFRLDLEVCPSGTRVQFLHKPGTS